MSNLIYSITIILICLTASQINICIAGELFRVLAVSGEIILAHNGQKNMLKAGQTIFDGDEIEIRQKGFVGLVATGGRSAELKQVGKYKASDLSKKISSKKDGAVMKFADYIADQITNKPENGTSNENYKSKMEATGAVERVRDDEVNIFNKTIELASGNENQMKHENKYNGSSSNQTTSINPRTGKILDGVVQFYWISENEDSNYNLHIRDQHHNTLFKNVIKGTHTSINVSELGIKRDECYFWSVCPEGADDSRRSEEYAICATTLTEQNEINKTLQQIKSELGETQSATAQLILAAFYEQNEIYDRAEYCYREAIRLAPDIDDIAIAMQRFHSKLGIPQQQ